MGKVLVLYVFHEYNDLVKNFINNGIFCDASTDFIIICNNKNIMFDVPFYVKKIIRENIGYDFAGWSEALLKDNLYKNYEKFIFVTSSAYGPFLKNEGRWTDVYLNELKHNIKLFGSTINTCEDPLNKAHVQSYIFAMNKETLEYLIKCEIFSITKYATTFDENIWNKQVAMSRKIVENGWNIGSLLPHYKNIDFTAANFSYYNMNFLNDIMHNEHRNVLWNEYQLVFVKGNRKISLAKI